MELLVSAVLLVLIVTGLLSIFVVGKRHLLHARSRMTAAELTRTFIDPLQRQVDQSQWGTNCLSGGSCAGFIGTRYFEPVQYNSTVTTSAVGATTLRRAIIAINWTETD